MVLLIGLASTLWGQSVVTLPGPKPLALPLWLAPFPQARLRSGKATPREITNSYLAAATVPAVIAHYEQQLRVRHIAFQTEPDGFGYSVTIAPEKGQAEVRVREEIDGAGVEVHYTLESRPAPPPPPLDPNPIVLEWPDWLRSPDGRLLSQQTKPAGRTTADSCFGDTLGQPSQGCLEKVYLSPRAIDELYAYFDGLLQSHGYTTKGTSRPTHADLDLGKSLGSGVAQLTMRQFPDGGDESRHRQIRIFLRQADGKVKIEMSFAVRN